VLPGSALCKLQVRFCSPFQDPAARTPALDTSLIHRPKHKDPKLGRSKIGTPTPPAPIARA
jgi:hypothetical protein